MPPLHFDLAAAPARPGSLAAAAIPGDPRFDQPSDAELIIAGEREAGRVIRCHRDGMARPDELLHSLVDLFADDGMALRPTARLRGWCRRLGKALES